MAVCRLCSRKDTVVDVFHAQLAHGEQLRLSILLATGIQIKETDLVSKMVCRRCTEIAVKLHKYRTNAVANDMLLKEQAGQPYTLPVTDPDQLACMAVNDQSNLDAIVKTEPEGDPKSLPDASSEEQMRANLIRAKRKHPSVQQLLQTDRNLVLPNTVLYSDVSPVITLDRTEISDFYQKQLQLCKNRLRHVIIRRVREATMAIDVSGDSTGDREQQTAMPIKFREMSNTSTRPIILGVSKPPINDAQNITSRLKPVATNINVPDRVPLRTQKTKHVYRRILDSDTESDDHDYETNDEPIHHQISVGIERNLRGDVQFQHGEKEMPSEMPRNTNGGTRSSPEPMRTQSDIGPTQNTSEVAEPIGRYTPEIKDGAAQKYIGKQKVSKTNDGDERNLSENLTNKDDMWRENDENRYLPGAVRKKDGNKENLRENGQIRNGDVGKQNVPAETRNKEHLGEFKDGGEVSTSRDVSDGIQDSILGTMDEENIKMTRVGRKRRFSSDSDTPEVMPEKKQRVFLGNEEQVERVLDGFVEANAPPELISSKALQIYICPICSKIYDTKRDFVKHEKLHQRCRFCKKRMRNLDVLCRHQARCGFVPEFKNVIEVKLVRVDEDLDVIKKYPQAFNESPITEEARPEEIIYSANADYTALGLHMEANDISMDHIVPTEVVPNVEIPCIVVSDDEVEYSEVPRHIIVENPFFSISSAPMSSRRIKPYLDLSETQMTRLLFKKHSYISIKRENFTQTSILPQSEIQYTQSNLIILENMFADLHTYKIPVQMIAQPRITARYKETLPSQTQLPMECWAHKPTIGLSKRDITIAMKKDVVNAPRASEVVPAMTKVAPPQQHPQQPPQQPQRNMVSNQVPAYYPSISNHPSGSLITLSSVVTGQESALVYSLTNSLQMEGNASRTQQAPPNSVNQSRSTSFLNNFFVIQKNHGQPSYVNVSGNTTFGPPPSYETATSTNKTMEKVSTSKSNGETCTTPFVRVRPVWELNTLSKH